jgi:ATP-dependent DNA helicase HFM1/MER3
MMMQLQAISQAIEFHDLRIKPAERPFLREFNNSPLLKFPLKENISLAWHKIYLMIQVQLGGFDLPSDGDFNMIRRQFVTETNIIFERAQRLIRFIIDCKSSDFDAVSVSNGLDLARSLSAMFWENSNLQLRQIPQLGTVGHRKLVAADINSIEKLCSCDTGTIERIMSRKPSYGHTLKTILLDFPRLIFTAEIIGQPNIKKGKQPTVKVLARLRFENKKVPVWKGRNPAVTFMAETSGTLVHVWRGKIMKLENTLELKFAVELQGPAENIQCKIACDEIVGTIKTTSITPHVPASAFPPPGHASTPAVIVDKWDDFGDDDLADDEMVAALRDVEGGNNRGSGAEKPSPNFKSVTATTYHDLNGFADIDGFEHKNTAANATSATKGNNEDKDVKEEEDSVVIETIKSAKMSNGRWACHHVCRDGAIQKTTGKPCKHRCCTEGLDKPRTIKRKVVNLTHYHINTLTINIGAES